MLLLLLSTIFSVVLSYEYHECNEVCIKYYSNLTQSLAGGENPFDHGSIKRPIFSRTKRHSGDDDDDHDDDFGISTEPPLHQHENFICYGGSCLERQEDYDINVMPYEESSFGQDAYLPVHIAMSIYVLDVGHGQLDMQFVLEVTWEDDRLRLCKCEDDTNEREAIFPQRVLSRIFVPDILFLDAITAESFVGYENSHGIWLNQFDKGVRVLWKKKLAMAIACDMNTRWVPYDVNACPVIITTDLHNAHRINVIMDILPQSSHIAKNREWHFGLEPLPFNREKTFMAFSKFGVDDLQYYTGFRVIVLRQLVPPKIFTVFVTFFVFLMCLLMLLPLKHEKLTCIGIFIMASSEMIDEVMEHEPNFLDLYYALGNFTWAIIYFLFVIMISMWIENRFESGRRAALFDTVCAIFAFIYWLFVGMASLDIRQLSLMCSDDQKTSMNVEGLGTMGLCIHNYHGDD